MLEKIFHLKENHTDVKTELMAKNEEWVSPELGDTSLEERTG